MNSAVRKLVIITVVNHDSTEANNYKSSKLNYLMQVFQLISLKQYILLVFYTPSSSYQFSIISPNGFVYQPKDIFDTYQRAETEGRLAIQLTS